MLRVIIIGAGIEAHRIRRANSFVRASQTSGRLFQLEIIWLVDYGIDSSSLQPIIASSKGLRRLADQENETT
jgi:hypothetical protein